MKTPNTDILYAPEFCDVYPPSEDSFLFLDAFEKDISFLDVLRPTVSVEVGSGSGILSSFLYLLSSAPCFHICTDISSAACKATAKVIRANMTSDKILATDSVRCSLASPLMDRLSSLVDVVLFNPPYVPTSPEEHASAGATIQATWSGGFRGRQVIDPFLKQAVSLLSPRGCIYLLLSDENIPSEVHETVRKLSDNRLKCTTILHRKVRNESLGIYRYSPNP
ncbi:unnamed protein product [Calicophoron daubneyi]|uniref:Methyltransferase HEMK2 n=1 Tax=Calicophoron daubneyi TaxID=300641 RepID=A0AAV2T704_CALDB